jgi:hypothetical protein
MADASTRVDHFMGRKGQRSVSYCAVPTTVPSELTGKTSTGVRIDYSARRRLTSPLEDSTERFSVTSDSSS